MPGVKIKFKDGMTRGFPYRAHVLGYEGAFVIIQGDREKKHAFPAADVQEVIETPRPRW